MKLYNLLVDGNQHLAADDGSGIKDLTSAGFPLNMDMLIRNDAVSEAKSYLENAPFVHNPVFSDIVNTPGKLICVGLNYRKHAEQARMQTYDAPALFSKFPDALVPSGAEVELSPWETTYDYEAELVIVIGSYVNGELRQDGTTSDMIFSCEEIISYASKYIALEPGDLVFTGTPSGTAMEGKKGWLKKGDTVEVEVEGIGRLINKMI